MNRIHKIWETSVVNEMHPNTVVTKRVANQTAILIDANVTAIEAKSMKKAVGRVGKIHIICSF